MHEISSLNEKELSKIFRKIIDLFGNPPVQNPKELVVSRIKTFKLESYGISEILNIIDELKDLLPAGSSPSVLAALSVFLYFEKRGKKELLSKITNLFGVSESAVRRSRSVYIKKI
jgi:transcription initiation factor TFIIIB Brf1 subunit/transcription initiation factor TFIIB